MKFKVWRKCFWYNLCLYIYIYIYIKPNIKIGYHVYLILAFWKWKHICLLLSFDKLTYRVNLFNSMETFQIFCHWNYFNPSSFKTMKVKNEKSFSSVKYLHCFKLASSLFWWLCCSSCCSSQSQRCCISFYWICRLARYHPDANVKCLLSLTLSYIFARALSRRLFKLVLKL